MSWHWQGGHVTGADPAADADLDMARALALAKKRFGGDSYLRAAKRMSSALLREETVTVRGRRVLVAGPWARHAPYPVDPSYFSPVAFEVLRKATGDRRFDALAASSRRLAGELTSGGRSLPPDWAVVAASGAARPSGPPGGGAPGYGLDAVRLPVRLAESCDKGDRRIAAAEWPSVRGAGGDHPAATVGAAAAAHAAGDGKAADGLLAQAEAADRRASTYYGAAWVALGRIELSSKALGGCG
jgi:endoglucanase